jgi:hypothetical protein
VHELTTPNPPTISSTTLSIKSILHHVTSNSFCHAVPISQLELRHDELEIETRDIFKPTNCSIPRHHRNQIGLKPRSTNTKPTVRLTAATGTAKLKRTDRPSVGLTDFVGRASEIEIAAA